MHARGEGRLSGTLSSRQAQWLLLGLCLFGFALRLINLNAAIWGDEAASWGFARRSPLLEMWQYALADPTPPLYYLVLHFLYPILGNRPFALRFPSVVAGVLIPLLMYSGLRQAGFTRGEGLLAALLGTLSSMLIYYAQEARAYSLLACMGCLSTILLNRAVRDQRHACIWAYAGTVAALPIIHYYALFLIAGQMLFLAWRRRWHTFIAAGVALTVVGLFMISQLLPQSFNYGAAGETADLQAIASLLNTLTIGTMGLQRLTRMPNAGDLALANPPINQWVPLAGLLAGGLAIWLTWRESGKKPVRQQDFVLLLWVCMVIPISLALLAGSRFSPKPQWLLRGLIYVWPLFLMALIAATSNVRWRSVLIAIVLAGNLMSLYPYYTTYARLLDGPALEQLDSQVGSTDLIVIDPWYMYELMRYYYHGPARLAGYDRVRGWIDVEAMIRSNKTDILATGKAPEPARNVYVYYRNTALQWAETFPTANIYVVDPGTRQWRTYTRD